LAKKCPNTDRWFSQPWTFWIYGNIRILNGIFLAKKCPNTDRWFSQPWTFGIKQYNRLFIEYNIAKYYKSNFREMGELSFLTIIVSLAVCSLLVYGIFQYMKIRLNVLEQSHREQALILQQYIEESSTDIHRLYQISTTRHNGTVQARPFEPQGSIILEYANEIIKEQQTSNEKPVAYNEPHTIHLDTAFFQNKRTNQLIEISSDSENTTDDGESNSDEGSSDESSSEGSSDESSSEGSSDEGSSDEGSSDEGNKVVECVSFSNNKVNELEDITQIQDEIISIPNEPTVVSEVKTITVDLGTLQEPEPSKKSSPTSNDVLSMFYKKAQQTPLPEDNDLDNNKTIDVNEIKIEPFHSSPLDIEGMLSSNTQSIHHSSASSAPVQVPLSSMSVPDLKQLLKELCKNQPEKYSEIQKLKKTELIYAIKQLQQ